LKEQIYKILNIVALIAYYLPLTVVILKKLWKDIPVLMFSTYWTLGGLINLIGSTHIVPSPAAEICYVVFNIIDVPFVLFIFYLNSGVPKLKAAFRILIPVYLFILVLNGLIRGFTDQAFKYFLGVGVLIVIVSVVAEIYYYFRKLDHTSREKAINFFYLAVLFEYAVYVYYYVYLYFLTAELTDTNIIYYGSTLIGIMIACFGFFSENLSKKPPAPPAPREHEVLINIID
jgi:hypothetical protein